MIHVWAAVDGMNMIKDRGGFITLEATKDGAKVAWNKRF